MPIARIITEDPAQLSSLAEYLRAQGYQVETVPTHDGFLYPVDLEMTAELHGLESALSRAQQLAEENTCDVLVAPGVVPSSPLFAATAQPSSFEAPSRIREEPEDQPQVVASGEISAENESATRSKPEQSLICEQAPVPPPGDHEPRHLLRNAVTSIDWQALAARCTDSVEALASAFKDTTRNLIQRSRQVTKGINDWLAQQSVRRTEWAKQRRRLREQELRKQAANALLKAAQKKSPEFVTQATPVTPPAPMPVSIARTSALAHGTEMTAAVRPCKRDWQMAFVGAAVASALIAFCFGVFARRTPAPTLKMVDAVQITPFGSAALNPPTTPLRLPRPERVAPSAPVYRASMTATPTAIERKTSLRTKWVRTQHAATGDDDDEPEVVVRHFRPAKPVAAKTLAGVKQYSDMK